MKLGVNDRRYLPQPDATGTTWLHVLPLQPVGDFPARSLLHQQFFHGVGIGDANDIAIALDESLLF